MIFELNVAFDANRYLAISGGDIKVAVRRGDAQLIAAVGKEPTSKGIGTPSFNSRPMTRPLRPGSVSSVLCS
jgi:hypothetical protein